MGHTITCASTLEISGIDVGILVARAACPSTRKHRTASEGVCV